MNKECISKVMNQTSLYTFGCGSTVSYYIALTKNLVINVDVVCNVVKSLKVFDTLEDAETDALMKYGYNKMRLVPNADLELKSMIVQLQDEIDIITKYHLTVYEELLTKSKSLNQPDSEIESKSLNQPDSEIESELLDQPDSEISDTVLPCIEKTTQHKKGKSKAKKEKITVSGRILNEKQLPIKKFIDKNVEKAGSDIGISVESLYKLYKPESNSNITYDEFVNLLSAVIKSPAAVKKGDSIKHILEGAKMNKLTKSKAVHAAKMYIASHFVKSSEKIQIKTLYSSVRSHINGDLSNSEIRSILVDLGICNVNDKIINGALISDDAITSNAEKCEEMRNIYKDTDISINDIAVMYGLSYGKAYAIIKNKDHIKKKPNFDWKKIQNFINDHTDMSVSKIAKELGIHPSTIYNAGVRGDINIDDVRVRKGRKGGKQ